MSGPENIAHYEERVSLWRLASAYAFGIAQNRRFVDGNKRADFMAMSLFLEKNCWSLTASEVDATLTFFSWPLAR